MDLKRFYITCTVVDYVMGIHTRISCKSQNSTYFIILSHEFIILHINLHNKSL